MWLAYTLHLLNMTATVGATMTVALYAAQLGAGAYVVGALMSASALPSIALGIAAGRLVDRFGIRPALFAGSLILALAPLLASAIPGLAMQFVTVSVLGAGYLLYMISQQSMVGAVSTPKTRARNFANLSLVYSLGGFLGPLAAGFLIEQRGYAAAFGVLGLLPLAAAALLLTDLAQRACPSPPRRPGAEQSASIGELLRCRPLRYVVIASGLALACVELFQFYGPLHAQAAGLTPSEVGAIMSAYAAAAIATRVFMPQLIELARGEEWLFVACLVMAMAACALFPLAGGAGMLALYACLLGAGLGCAQPLSMMMTYTASPPGRAGEGLGLRFMLSSSARLILPLALGPVGASAGLLAVFLAKAGILGASTALAWRLPDRRSASQRPRLAPDPERSEAIR